MTDSLDRAVHGLLEVLGPGTGGIDFEPRAVRRWLDDCARLAVSEPGQRAAAVAEEPLLAAVYLDLESIERRGRAELVLGFTRVLARRLPSSLGSAALDLIAPLAAGAPDALRRGFRREIERGVSARLFELPEAGAAVQDAHDAHDAHDGDGGGGGGGVLRALAQLGARLCSGSDVTFEGAVACAEAQLADGDGAAIAAALDTLHGTLDGAAEPVVAQDIFERLRIAVAFEAGDDALVLKTLVGGVLALDRSASAGAVRAVASYRLRAERAGGQGQRDRSGGAAAGPIDASERKRIARFLALAAGTARRTEVETT